MNTTTTAVKDNFRPIRYSTWQAPNGDYYAEVTDDPETNASGATETLAIGNLDDLLGLGERFERDDECGRD